MYKHQLIRDNLKEKTFDKYPFIIVGLPPNLINDVMFV